MAELTGQGPLIQGGATTVIDTAAVQKIGQHCVDIDGYEYVYVDFQEACTPGEFVYFGSDFLAHQLTSTGRGWVGVVISTVSASDRFGWVMVRGVHTAAWVSSGSSAAGVAVATVTTDVGNISTVAAGTGGVAVFGVSITTDPDTCASSTLFTGTSLSGQSTVLLNYPFITGAIQALTS